MPKIQDFRIEFERPGATYASGETVGGNVILNLSGPKNVREIRLEAQGEADVHWTKTRQRKDSRGVSHTETDHYRGSENYFSVANRLIGNASGEGQTTLPAGQHSYHFSFQLPSNIPCSIEHVLGYVRYTVKAVLDRPWRFDHKVISAFTVVAHYDLNTQPTLTMGINDDIRRRFYSCCCCGNAGVLTAQVKSRVSGFVPGETIEIIINYDNKSNSVELNKIKLKLYKYIEFFATSPFPDKKLYSDVIKKVKLTGPMPKKGETSLKIEVPPLPPSKLEHCSIINVSYKLVLSIATSGFHHDIDRTYPVEIGTIPLYYQTAGGQSQAPQNLGLMPTHPVAASAPPIDQVNASSQLLQPSLTAAAAGQPIGFVVMSAPPYMAGGSHPQPMPEMPPPSYEECVSGSNNISDQNEQGMHGPNVQFAPKYPVYKFPMPMPYPP